MKKNMLLIVTVIAFVLLVIFPVSGIEASDKTSQSPDEKVIYESEPIVNVEELLERGKKGITDDELIDNQVNLYANLKNDNKQTEIKAYSTSQLLKKVKDPSGNTVETYAMTQVIPIKKKQLQDSGSWSDEKGDDSHSVYAYSTMYYERSGNQIGLTRVSGGWDIRDIGVHIEDQYVRYQQEPTHSSSFSPSGLSFDRATEDWGKTLSRWGAMNINTSTTLVGHGSSWELNLTNIYGE